MGVMFETFKPKLFFISRSNARQPAIMRRTWFINGWLRKVSYRLIKKPHTPCITFAVSKWFYSVQYSHFFSINVRRPGWDKR